jgi:hypothetical protein
MNAIRTAQPARKRVEIYKPKNVKFPLVLLQDPTSQFIFWGQISMDDEKHLTQEDVEDLFSAGDDVEISPIMSVAFFWNNWGNPNKAEPSKMVKSPTGDYYHFNKYRKQIAALYGNPGVEDDPAPLTSSEKEVKNYSRQRRILWLIDHTGGGGSGSKVSECCYWS